MSLAYEDWENELAIDGFVIVYNHLYLLEKSIRHEIEPQQMEHEIKPERVALLEICKELFSQRCALHLVCRRILSYARRIDKTGYLDRKMGKEIVGRAFIWHLKTEKSACCSAGETKDVDEQLLLKLQRKDLHIRFQELVEGMCACKLDNLHKEKLEDLMVYDPKRNIRVPIRFCSFHLAGFNLDEKSTAELGPRYQPDPLLSGTRLTKYVVGNTHYDLAAYSTEVISIRVVKAGPDYTYPVEVYGKVIARDEIDYKCVYLFDRERKDAQTIKSKKDMLALAGPYRALVTLGFMYFEFDLKTKGKDGPDDEVEFSKGVISYYCNPDHKRIIFQLPSFQSTVKLVLQHVAAPVGASLEVSIVNKGPQDPLVHFNGKITAGTTRNYRQHIVLYDSSVRSGNLVREDGSLVLNRNLVSVYGYVPKRAIEKDEERVLYVCFLDSGREIEDKDEMGPEDEDEDKEDEKEEEKEKDKDKDKDKDKEEEENVVTLKCPESEIVWEHGCPNLKVKVRWTAVLDRPVRTDSFQRYSRLPDGCSIDYRWGNCYE